MEGSRTSQRTGLPRVSVHEHTAQFYARERFLIEAATRFLKLAIQQGQSAIVLATPDRRRQLGDRLREAGLDLDHASQLGRYIELDAEEFLSTILVNGRPDRERFADMMGPLVLRANQVSGCTAIFGDAVSVLCSKGQTEEAIELEHLWNDLAKRFEFALLCGYSACHSLFPNHKDAVARICAVHSDVLPEESFLELEGNDRLRYVAELQQKVRGQDLQLADHRRSEEALARSEKLAEMGRLAAMIAHEINSPLTSLTNIIYLLGSHDSLDPAARQYVAMADEELRRMARITKQVLGFYRESPKAVPCKISRIIDDVLELYEPKLAKSHISVQRDYRVEGLIEGYPSEMRQVFANLIGNAIDAMGQHGRIRVRVSSTRDWTRPRRSAVRVSIADSGPGIPQANRHLVFHPFFTTKGESGTGLGLWLSRGIVGRHEGRMTLRSRPGRERHGTVFSIVVPAAGQETRSHSQVQSTETRNIAA